MRRFVSAATTLMLLALMFAAPSSISTASADADAPAFDLRSPITLRGGAVPPPSITTSAWFDWYENHIAFRVSECVFPRDHTRYVSSSDGDDANDGLTPQTAWASLAPVVLWLANPGPGTQEILFKRGDTIRSRFGILTNRPGIRFADYDDPELPKPRVTGFADVFPAGGGGWTQLDAPNNKVFSRPMMTTAYWVRQDGDADLDYPLSRRSSVVALQFNQGSWWYDSDTMTLYVHPRESVNINSCDIEVCTATNNGFQFSGDQSLIENLRVDGWGFNVLQADPIQARVRDENRAVIRNCEAYYGYSHAISHFVGGGGGGIVTIIDCTAGFTSFHTAGETVFNSYAWAGYQETIFHNCTVSRGTLPSDNFVGKRGVAAFAHTRGGNTPNGLVIVYGMRILRQSFGAIAPPRFSDMPRVPDVQNVRGFIVNSEFEGGLFTGSTVSPIANAGVAIVNTRYAFNPPYLANRTIQIVDVDGWFINSTLELDVFSQSDPWFALYNTGSAANKARIWNSAILVYNIRPGTQVRIDGAGPDSSPNSQMFNSIYAKMSGEGELVANLPETLNHMFANAFYGVTAPPENLLSVVLGAAPADGPPHPESPLVGAGIPWPSTMPMDYDQAMRPRTSNTIGPFEATLTGDLDGDGVVNASDLSLLLGSWGACPPMPTPCIADLNGDGVVDAADLSGLLGSWS